ncbi:hypothetical protein [Streptomyces sp. bgisy034]|uniref:hypothetical protein n=1 Tax=Streptomyces sp. bgisy034 TaxID=3413774 RepID=UPI003EBC0E5E
MNRHATSAISTDRGRLPPANAAPDGTDAAPDGTDAAPDGTDAAPAAAGAIAVMLWNRTSRNPIASRRRPVVPSSAFSPDMCIPLVHPVAPRVAVTRRLRLA